MYFILRNDTPSVLTAFLKCLPIINLIIFNWTTTGLYSRDAFSRKILFALILCCIGDFFLVWPSYFTIGMIMFAIAHIIYIIAFGFIPFNGILGLVLQLGGVFTSYLLVPNLHGILTIGVPVYVIILIIMAWRAMSRISLSRKSWSWTGINSWIGGVFFLISDTMLGFHNFYNPIRYGQIIIMLTYYIAQLGLTLSSIHI